MLAGFRVPPVPPPVPLGVTEPSGFTVVAPAAGMFPAPPPGTLTGLV